eukprot:82793-Amphidinium_carterae.1
MAQRQLRVSARGSDYECDFASCSKQVCMAHSSQALRELRLRRPYKEMLFNPSGCGLALLLYSLVYTRGTEVR